MKVKLISDGTARNTTIIDTKTGEALEGVTHIYWHIETEQLAECTIRLHNIPLEVYADEIKSYELSNRDENSSS